MTCAETKRKEKQRAKDELANELQKQLAVGMAAAAANGGSSTALLQQQWERAVESNTNKREQIQRDADGLQTQLQAKLEQIGSLQDELRVLREKEDRKSKMLVELRTFQDQVSKQLGEKHQLELEVHRSGHFCVCLCLCLCLS